MKPRFKIALALLIIVSGSCLISSFTTSKNGKPSGRTINREQQRSAVAINQLLENLCRSQSMQNEKLVAELTVAIDQRGNRESDRLLLRNIRELDNLSKDLVSWIGLNCKLYMINLAGGWDDSGICPKKGDDMNIPRKLFLGTLSMEGSVLGEDFERNLDRYYDRINSLNLEIRNNLDLPEGEAPVIKSLTQTGEEDLYFRVYKETKNRSFLNVNFMNLTVNEAIGLLTEKQAQILINEYEIISCIRNNLGVGDFENSDQEIVVSVESKIVPAGGYYKARLFSSVKPKTGEELEFFINGKPLKVTNGVADVGFRASYTGQEVDNYGNKKKSWEALLRVVDNSGNIREFNKTVTYFVSLPEIIVESNPASMLYANCGNELSFKVPSLGERYNPVIRTEGSMMRKMATKGDVVLIPTKPEVTAYVVSGGMTVGSKKFKVQSIPKPEIVATSGGIEIDRKRGVPFPGPKTISVRVIPDETFKALFPKDARYKVTEWTATLARGKEIIDLLTFKEAEGDLSSFSKKRQSADRILIEVKEVLRKSYSGSTEIVEMHNEIINIPLF